MLQRERDFTLSANGTAGPYHHAGGTLTVQVVGTWGGGSIDVQMNIGNGAGSVYTLNSGEPCRLFEFPPNAVITFVLSGATSPSLTIGCR